MSLTELKSKSPTKRKRVGRGNSAGQGSTCGRGNKGQHQRTGGKIRPDFEGGQTPFLRKMPKLKGFNNPGKVIYQVVKTDSLNMFADGEKVDTTSLLAKRLISKKGIPVKILLGSEKLTKKLVVEVSCASKTAEEALKEAKCEVTLFNQK